MEKILNNRVIQSNVFICLLVVFLLFGKTGVAENPFGADIVVAADGTGDFTKVQAAIDAVPSNSERRTVIYIKRGIYDQEKLMVPGEKINITLIGESRDETILSYHIYDCTAGKCPPEDATKWTGDNIRTSATLTVMGNGFRAENLTIRNTAGPVGQAQAATIRSDKCVFINCNLEGYQDTLYFWSEGNRSYFQNCLVVGRTDYIYGGAIVFFQGCEIRSWGGGWITAPSTPQAQAYGFVFNECQLTYALNSPRSGDDGVKVRFGRPWHNYPKVAWLRCTMTEYIHPEGWGDTWSMDYAATSPDLHLYEYKNTGAGADKSGRAAWVGIKELNDTEALNYTVQKVMGATDGWDPTAEAPLIQSFFWKATGASGWLVAGNWEPEAIPQTGESASVIGDKTIIADGDTFAADLNLKDSAKLEIISPSTASYISVANAVISSGAEVSLSGKIATKDKVEFNISGVLTLNLTLSGVHELTKTGTGKLILASDNLNFSGNLIVNSGTVEAAVANSLGKGNITVKNGASLILGHGNSLQAKSKLEVETGSNLVLNATVTTSEFFIGDSMQIVGEYNSTTNPGLISGPGKIVVGRPDVFTFIGGANGNWDNPVHFVPALLPLAGESVIVSKEIETTSTNFLADIILKSPGNVRLRGSHTCLGTIFMESGTNFRYNTGGAGMSLNAPIMVEGDVQMIMESGNANGSVMELKGAIKGSGKMTALNNGKGTVNSGTLLLTGDNSGFTGTWDLTFYSTKYPSIPGYLTFVEGKSENAFGAGKIVAGLGNKVILNHQKCAGNSLDITLSGNARVVLSANIEVIDYTLNGTSVDNGIYSATTHPDIYEGSGTLTVGTTHTETIGKFNLIQYYKETLFLLGNQSEIAVYDILGNKIFQNTNKVNSVKNLTPGIYIVKYDVDNQKGVLKIRK